MPRGNEIPEPRDRFPEDDILGLRETLHAQATRLAMHANTITQLRRRVRELEAELAGVGR